MLLSKKVDLILSGHEHTYQRSHQLSLSAGCPALVPTTFDADCVADSGSSFVKGVGSVIGVVGTGGVGFYNVNSADPEAGYFSVLSGANANPTMGVLDVSATENQLRADFVAAAGGNQSDTFTITRGAANTPPVAAFTSTCTELACTFDGSGSSDPDGSIAGTRGTSATVPRAPARTRPTPTPTAGTYPVALTVTDNGGAPNTLTRNVTVTGGGTTTTYVADQFSRTVASGFGTAPVGGTWTHSTALSNFSVNGTQGRIRVAAGSGPAAYLASTNAPNADVKTSFSLDKVPTGNGLYVTVVGRRTASAGLYCAEARVTSTGAVALELCRRSASGTETVVQAAVTVPGTYAVGETLNLRLQVTGTSPTTLRAKVWESGTAEPATWQRLGDRYDRWSPDGRIGRHHALSVVECHELAGHVAGRRTDRHGALSLIRTRNADTSRGCGGVERAGRRRRPGDSVAVAPRSRVRRASSRLRSAASGARRARSRTGRRCPTAD